MTKLKKTIIFSVIFIAVCIGFGLVYNDLLSLDNPKYYRQAVDFYEKKDYQNSYYNFSKIKRISPLYKAALLKQGICAENLADYPTAIKKYTMLIHKYPKSIFVPKARYRLARCYFYNKQLDLAKKEFKHVQKHSSDENLIIASNYYLGMIEKDRDKKLAKEYFVGYISMSPKGKYALASADELMNLPEKMSPYESLIVGEVFFHNKKYMKSVKFFKNAEFKKAWPYIGIAYGKVGYPRPSRLAIDTGIKKYSRTVNPELLNEALEYYASVLSPDKKQSWQQILKYILENKSAGEDFALYNLAKYLPEPQNLNLYATVSYKYPNSLYASESMWNLFWHAYETGNLDTAKKIGNSHLKRYPDAAANPRVLFWLAKIACKQGKSNESNSLLNKILVKHPDSYYAFRADSLLKGNKSSFGTKSYHELDTRSFNIEFPIKYSNLDIKDLKLINTLLGFGDYEIWNEVEFDNEFVESWFEYKRGHRAKSTLLARDALAKLQIKPPFSDDAYKLAYPIHWAADINKTSASLHLDPFLMISLIREESYFNPISLSSSNAVGLMQVMPSTAHYIADKYNMPHYGVNSLMVPENNIKIGSTYFAFIKKTLNDDDLYAVAAYNGGPNAVKSWQDKIKYSDYDEFVENIPYPETKTYVKKVYRSYWNYLNIYNY